MRRLTLLLLGAAAVLGCGGDDGGGDATGADGGFCARLEHLTDNDPFRAFGDRATAAEIELAFGALVERAGELAATAPPEIRPTARAYAGAATRLDSLLAGAAFDGAAVDARAYRAAQVDYAEAAALLERYLATDC